MAAAAETRGQEAGTSAGKPRARVLVVEDEAAMSRALRINLRARDMAASSSTTSTRARGLPAEV